MLATPFFARVLALAATFTLLQTAAAPAAMLPRSHIVLSSAIAVDPVAGTVTLPLHRGSAGSKIVWYIVTDSSEAADAKRRGVIFSPVLAGVGTDCAACLRRATESSSGIAFPGAPDFSPKRVFKPGPTGFPPAAAAPGATADSSYTPFLKIGDAVVNAPIVATGAGPFDVFTHTNTADRVVRIDPVNRTVTLVLARGFANGKRVLYISTEASDPGAATIERATYVPSLKAKGGTIPIYVVANGSKQGLAYVALHGDALEATAANLARLASPMNILALFPIGPAAMAYSPLWEANVAAWSAAAKAANRDVVLKSTDDITAQGSSLTAPGGGPVGPVGFVVNCPVIAYVDSAP
jgi:hypothetical protein